MSAGCGNSSTAAGCSGCGGGAEREPYVETRTFTDIVTLTSENFQTEVLDDPGLILIDFWAEWCQPCRMLAPELKALADEYAGRVVVGKVNVDEEPELAAAFRVASIPTVVVIRDGKVVRTSVGYKPKEALAALLA